MRWGTFTISISAKGRRGRSACGTISRASWYHRRPEQAESPDPASRHPGPGRQPGSGCGTARCDRVTTRVGRESIAVGLIHGPVIAAARMDHDVKSLAGGRSVLDYFEELVRAQPQAVAIKDTSPGASRVMTRAELEAGSNRVAAELIRRGLRLEESVALLLPASCELLCGAIGILKAGGTYFPIDVDIPNMRLEFLLRDSGSALV